MSLGARIREERQRLGMNQTDFAALAGAGRRAMVNWESDGAAPLVTALTAWAEAGADALYIITGRRTADRPDNPATQIEEQLAGIRRDLLDPGRRRLQGEDDQRAEERVLQISRNSLTAMLNFDRAFMTPELRSEVEHLLDIVENPASLSLYRAADRAQLRKKRDDVRRGIREWLEGGPYEPDEAVMYMLTALAMEYGVPVRFLAELVEEMHRNITDAATTDEPASG